MIIQNDGHLFMPEILECLPTEMILLMDICGIILSINDQQTAS